MQRLRAGIHDIMPPPALLGMGPGRATMPMKFQAVVHAMNLVAGPDKHLEKFVRSIRSWVSDLGMEAGFASVSKVPLSTLFPFLESSPDVDFADVLQCDWEVDFSNPPGPADSQPYTDTEGSIMVPHNCFHSLCDNLEFCSDVVDKLPSVCDMVGRPESKERLLSTCYQDRVGQALAPDIKDISSFVYDNRWGTVWRCILNILRCEALCGSAGTQGLSCQDPTLQTMSMIWKVPWRPAIAISSPFWWQYLRMLSAFARLQTTLMSWAEGCNCHWVLLQEDHFSDKLKTLWKSCPLRGRLCADLACGKFGDHVQRLGGKSNKQFQGSGSLV